ncbi:MAG: K(+)-transporting ATPase subunit C [Oscillospiraceae bacterium]
MNSIKFILQRSALMLLIFTVICGVLYTTTVTAAAQLLFPRQANGSIIEVNGKKYGCELLGQKYTDDTHMWGRIMNIDTATFKDKNGKTLMYAVPSNLSPASKEYEAIVTERVAMIKAANPTMSQTAIPVDLVTCSGSGLDPHISKAAAEYQIARIAAASNKSEKDIRAIVERCTDGKLLGVFGEETVNVLEVNLIIDGILR